MLLRRIIRKIFSPNEKVIQKVVVFKDSYGNGVYIEIIIKNDKKYMYVIIDWFSSNVFRIEMDDFLDHYTNLIELKSIILENNYQEFDYDYMVVRPITPFPNLGLVAKNVYKKFTLIYSKINQPIIEMYLCNYNDEYYFMLNLRDKLSGNIRRVSIEDGLEIVEALLLCSYRRA